MAPEDMAKLRLQLLLKESDDLHDNIQRNLNEMHKIALVGFPVLTGAFALLLEGKIGAALKAELLDRQLLMVLLAILISLMVVGFNNLWIQLGTFTRYKYAEVLPRLYEMTGREGDNYGKYTTRQGTVRAMIGVIIVQAILLPLAFVATQHAATNERVMELVAYFAFTAAALTTVASWIEAYKTVAVIRLGQSAR